MTFFGYKIYFWSNENNPLCYTCPHINIVDDEADNSSITDIELLQGMIEEYGIVD